MMSATRPPGLESESEELKIIKKQLRRQRSVDSEEQKMSQRE